MPYENKTAYSLLCPDGKPDDVRAVCRVGQVRPLVRGYEQRDGYPQTGVLHRALPGLAQRLPSAAFRQEGLYLPQRLFLPLRR
ncbi:MAG: hypothetical protein IKN91_08815 [Paludibacteraceae bacterium]|nr:hypothetical protein [Paludibacteraceae bacterium]